MAATSLSAQNAHISEKRKPHVASESPLPQMVGNGIVTIANSPGEPLTERQIFLLEERGINVELAVKMGWRGQKDTGNIQIPYYINGMEVNCKTRSLEGERVFYQVKDGEKCFYNVDILKENPETLIITEGEADAIIALQCGFQAISVPDGAPATEIGDKETVKYDYLKDIPESIKKIILATDNDNPGLNLLNDLGLRLGKHRCLWVKYPVGCKDLNEAFVKYGERGVKETIARAQYMKIEGLTRLSEMQPLPQHPALDVGIDLLNDHFKMRLGDFSVFTGIPSFGKTTFSNQIAFNMAWKHGWNVCCASFEQSPQIEHRRALRTLYTQKPEWKQTEEELDYADKFIEKYFSFIVPSDDLNEWADMTWLKDRMIAAVTRFQSRLIIIDPWNELDHMYDNHSISVTQYVGKCIKELKRFAQKYQVHVMVIAHPAKMQRLKDGTYPIPTPYDISDSSHWYNKPEQIVIVHREDQETTLIRVAKSRYHQILGKPGEIRLKFNTENYQYVKKLETTLI